jgi:hypothetical protein
MASTYAILGDNINKLIRKGGNGKKDRGEIMRKSESKRQYTCR